MPSTQPRQPPGSRIHPGSSPADRALQLAVFAVLLALYWFTAPRTVVLEDDGLFILSSWFLGIEHPPGYPLYVLLGKLATLLPLGSPAWRVHALSGLLGALACVLIYRIARLLIPGHTPALLAALGLGVSQTFWSQALIAEVYSLHALLLFALLSWGIADRLDTGQDAERRTDRRIALSALVAGLGVANHWPLLALSGPGLLLLWLPRYRRVLARLPHLIAWFALGLLPYAWMVWRSQQLPEISFLGPIENWRDFVDYFLRRAYSDIDSSETAGLADRLQYLAFLLRLGGMQLLLPGALLALLGALGQWRAWTWPIATGLTLAFLGPTLLLTLLLGFDYTGQMREVFRVYPLPAWGILALWAGLGLQLLATRFPAPRRRLYNVAVTCAVLGTSLAVHWQRNDRHGDWLASSYAAQLLANPAPGSVFLLAGEAMIPSTAYLHLIEQVRPDLLLVSEPGLVLKSRLFDPKRNPPERARQIVDANLAVTNRPVYRMHNRDGRSGTLNWLGFQLETGSEPGSRSVRFEPAPGELALLQRLVDNGPFADGWNELLRRALLTDFAIFFTRAELASAAWTADPALKPLLRAILARPDAALARAERLLQTDPGAHADEITQLLALVRAGITDLWLTPSQRARFYALVAAPP